MNVLYNLSVEKQKLFCIIDEQEGVIDEALEKRLQVFDTNEKNNLLILREYLIKKEDLVKLAKEKAAYFTEIAAKTKNAMENTKHRIIQYMEERGLETIEDGLDKLSIVNNPPKVTVTDPNEIPLAYKNISIKINGSDANKITNLFKKNGIAILNSNIEINKTKIHNSYKNGMEVNGTKMERGKRLKYI
jgi:archaellum component FlaG (FlaF/FlaG flagellin family)